MVDKNKQAVRLSQIYLACLGGYFILNLLLNLFASTSDTLLPDSTVLLPFVLLLLPVMLVLPVALIVFLIFVISALYNAKAFDPGKVALYTALVGISTFLVFAQVWLLQS